VREQEGVKPRKDAHPQNLYPEPDVANGCDPMIPGGRVNPKQMRQAMKRMGIEQEELDGVEEVVIRTADKEYVIRNAAVTAITAQGQKIWQVIGEPIVRERADAKKAQAAAPSSIPDEDVQLVAEKAGVSEDEARRALEEAGGEPAEAIIRLMSR
jgi:nascent polypeptide-associated complex subunit alpha